MLIDIMSFFPGVPAQKPAPIVLAGVGAGSDQKGKRKRRCGMRIQGGPWLVWLSGLSAGL